mmetsp:Transcript_36146/g.60926  ORF Transcript_36146/g.60926 Transcript_36146/m.60926 type:complete len:220 (+) Transcript_36146:456-1115(+)
MSNVFRGSPRCLFPRWALITVSASPGGRPRASQPSDDRLQARPQRTVLPWKKRVARMLCTPSCVICLSTPVRLAFLPTSTTYQRTLSGPSRTLSLTSIERKRSSPPSQIISCVFAASLVSASSSGSASLLVLLNRAASSAEPKNGGLHTRTSKLPSSGRREEDRGPTSASAVKTGACRTSMLPWSPAAITFEAATVSEDRSQSRPSVNSQLAALAPSIG